MTKLILKTRQRKSAWLDYFIVTILIFMSGNPALTIEGRNEVLTVIISFCFLIMLYMRKETIATPRFIAVALIFSCVVVVQGFTFSFWPYRTIFGFLLRLFMAYAAVTLVKEFPRKYIIVMFYTCIISFFFYFFGILRETTGIDLISFLAPIDKLANPERGFHIFVHNYLAYGRIPPFSNQNPFRNSSYFWEPGAFAGYLLLAIIFLGMYKDKFEKRQYKNMLSIMIIALLTTMSTGGYVLLPLCLLFHVKLSQLTVKHVPIVVAVGLIMAMLLPVFFYMEFLWPKIKNEYVTAVNYGRGWEYSRFGSILVDVEYIKRHPFFGYGGHEKTRFMLHGGQSLEGMGNGLSDFTVRHGLIGMATALIFIGASIYRLTNYDLGKAILFVSFIVLALNFEIFLNYPLFISLMFLGGMSRAGPVISGAKVQ